MIAAQLAAPSPETYGTSAETAIAIPDWELNPYQSTTTFAWLNGRYITSASGLLVAGIHLPEGALITRMEVQGCDSNTTKSLTVLLDYRPNNSGLSNTLAQLTTGANTGCVLFPVTLSTPHTVNNAINSYFIAADTGGATDASITILAVRVFYKLQVSPGPATATFADVPTTHPLFKFVEALYAAGITAGCSNGNFCPDAPVTRGQMAVFLSAALGLHFAP